VKLGYEFESSVAPGFTLARTNSSMDRGEVSGIAASRISRELIAAAIVIIPDFAGSNRMSAPRNRILELPTSTRPSKGPRSSGRCSFCFRSLISHVQQHLQPSGRDGIGMSGNKMRAQNQIVSGKCVRCITVRAVIEV